MSASASVGLFALLMSLLSAPLFKPEVGHVSELKRKKSNLKLNHNKSAEMVIRKPRSKLEIPSNATNLPRVASMVILGVTVTDTLSFATHIKNIKLCCQARRSLYALRIPRSAWPPRTQFARCGTCYNSSKNALCLTSMVGIYFPERPRGARSGAATSNQRAIPPLRHSNHRAAMPKCGLSPILSCAEKRRTCLT